MHKDVSIIGAGLVGSLLSIYLARRGYAVSVFERRPDMRKEKIAAGRSINLALSDRGWRGLDNVGLKDEVTKIAIPMYGRMVHGTDGKQNLQPYGKTDQAIYSVSRSALNKLLLNVAEQQPNIRINFNNRADRIDLDRREIIFNVQTFFIENNTNFSASTSSQKVQSFDLLFGADGAYSALRHSMQFTDRFNYSQSYIEHGYKELTIPAGINEHHLLYKNALHIWPRKNFMLIALPNLDGSFTCTLFFQFDGSLSFSTLKTEADIQHFFEEYFPDCIPLMPAYKEDFLNNPVASLVTVKCFPWTSEDKASLIGDAAHAMVPFFGQGMNCGFEDCTVLDDLISRHGENWQLILSEFESLRKPNADAIAELALNNFIEMRDLVADPHFLKKKKIEKLLTEKYPQEFISPYSMVSFSHIPYAEALRKGKAIKELLEKLANEEHIETAIERPEISEWMKSFANS
ncbi:MAG: FAD-dependent monooxygenase [Chitinophagales bacterium]|nr:FAD-dependent monooxygenase [Chitinophagales bacterium]